MRSRLSPGQRMVLLVLLALTLAGRLAVAVADHRALIALDVLQDDAFYYFEIARNVVSGRGLTFDGSGPTGGFQPLFLALLLPFSGWSSEGVIRAAGVLLSLAATATGLLAFDLTRCLAGVRTGLVALALWASSPYFLLFGVNGQETGLAMLLALAVLQVYLRRVRQRERVTRGAALGLGLVSGLALLARIDLVLLLLALALDWLRFLWHRGTRGQLLGRAALAVAATLALWLPWGLASKTLTGAWLPQSGVASRTIALSYGWTNLESVWSARGERSFDPQRPPPSYFADVATREAFVFLFCHPLLAPLRADLPHQVWPQLEAYRPYRWFRSAPRAGSAVAAALLIALVLRQARRRELRDALDLSLSLYLLATFAGYVFVCPAHWHFPRYLCVPILVSTIWFLALLRRELAPLLARARGWRISAAVGALALVLLQVNAWPASITSGLSWSQASSGGFLAQWELLEPGIDPARRVGAFQAGIHAYFSGRDVVNLDGKVNPAAHRALKAKQLHAYIRAEGIDYILDWDWVFRSLCGRFTSPQELPLRKVGHVSGPGGMTLWEVGAGEE